MWYCSEAGNREQGTGNVGFRGLSILYAMKDFTQKCGMQRACIVIGPSEWTAVIPSFPFPCSPVPASP